MNEVDFIQSVAFSQPLLNVNKTREYIEINYLDADDPLGHAIAVAHDVKYSTVNKYIDERFTLEKLALAPITCKIWHGTGDKNVPVELNAMPFMALRITHHLPSALEIASGTGHDKEGYCYSDHKSIIQFFHQNE